MNTIHIKLLASGAALLLAGCATLGPSSPPPIGKANLSIGLDKGLDIQALPEDVASATVKVTVAGETKTFSADAPERESPNHPASFFIDLDDLPEGPAVVAVDAYDASNQLIGSGLGSTLLKTGRRNFLQVTIELRGEGRTWFTPLTPLGGLWPQGGTNPSQ